MSRLLLRLRRPAASVLVRLFTHLGRVLPPEALRRIGESLGSAYWCLFKGRHRIAVINVRTAFKTVSEKQARRIVRRSYRHFGRMAAEFILVPRLTTAAIRRMVRPDPVEWRGLVDAVRSGSGVVFVTAHFGNWEIPPALLAAEGAGISAIYRQQTIRAVDELLVKNRRLLGYRLISKPLPVRLKLRDREIIFRDESLHRKVRRVLSSGGVLAFLADQNARGSGILVDFFGRKASTARGPFIYARRTGARVFFAAMPVLPDGTIEFRIKEFTTADTGDLRADLASDCRSLNRFYESVIRERPWQWLWAHNRWGLEKT
jgi:KDO2-lipid IV(A) lauroyltransferase